MIKRILKNKIITSLENFPAVGILGSRQVGKTTLAKEIQKEWPQKAVYIDLELPSDFNKLANPEIYLNQYVDNLVIIDEVQRMPELFPLLRALIDQKRVNGRFLILGSASPDLIKKASESLAGRIAYHELTPFLISEVGNEPTAINKLWLAGGYPQSYLAKTDQVSVQWRQNFLKTYLERDLVQLGFNTPALRLQRFITMAAHLNGQLLNLHQLANSLDLSAPTIKHYLDIFEHTFIIRQLPPYYLNIKKRLVKSPKLYLRDSGLLHSLLGQTTFDELQGYPAIGSSWESFIVEQLISSMPASWQAYFYRTSGGAEIDLLLVSDKNKFIAVEIKYSLSPKTPRGFWQAFQDLSCDKGYVVYPGQESYPLAQNTTVLPAGELTQIFI